MRDKTSEVKISANEINRYMYCPYQWYYKKTYGNKTLQEHYKALGMKTSSHENHYTKGMNHHRRYHSHYRFKLIIQGSGILVLLALLLRWVIGL